MSFKGEVIADNSGQWVSNALRFATEAEAQGYIKHLAWRWTMVRDTRVVECDDPVGYEWNVETNELTSLDSGYTREPPDRGTSPW
jgi:hypothetical protein